MLLRHARIVTPDEILEDASLLIEDGRIVKIFPPGAVDLHANAHPDELDLRGMLLFPGLIDVHIHGAIGIDTMEAGAADLRRAANFLATKGVTSWLPTLVPAPDEDYRRAVGAIEELMREEGAFARPLGVHYEGPFVNGAQCGALRANYFLTYAEGTEISRLTQISFPGAVHLTTLAPEIEGGIKLIEQLTAEGWVASIGHTRANVAELNEAFRAGARHMTHFMNAMPPLHHRAPGPVGWGLTHDGVTCDMIADGHHLDPLTLQLILRCKTSRGVMLISDAVAPAGLGDGSYHIWNETITVEGGRTSNERGSIAGSVITMLDAVRMMLSLGADPVTVARLGATNPARLIGKDDERGSIEEGKRADLFALDEHNEVKLTLVGGEAAKIEEVG